MYEMLMSADQAGVELLAVPDGETGARGNWLVDQVLALGLGHPALTQGDVGKNFSGYDDVPAVAQVVDESGFTADSLRVRLGYTHHANQAQLALEDLRTFGLGREVPLQVGIPAPLDLALTTLGVPGLAHVPTFQQAVAAHVQDVHALAPDAIVQLETPLAMTLAELEPGTPGAVEPAVLCQGITDTAAQAPEGTTFGVHLCFGDLNHESRVDKALTRPSVTLARALVANWPAGRRLAYLHVPLAAGTVTPGLDADDYAPLAELGAVVPDDVRVVAGIAHEAQSLDDQRKVLQMVDEAVGRPVDVAAACGLGRRLLQNARIVAQHMMALANTPA
jgi:hypothetical protein